MGVHSFLHSVGFFGLHLIALSIRSGPVLPTVCHLRSTCLLKVASAGIPIVLLQVRLVLYTLALLIIRRELLIISLLLIRSENSHKLQKGPVLDNVPCM